MTQPRTNIIGIDLGNRGALALLSPEAELLAWADMPTLESGPASRPRVNGSLLADLLREWKPRECYVELVEARKTDGPVGAFAFGLSRGVVEGALNAYRVPLRYLPVITWKRAIGIKAGRDRKDDARAEAVRRWPQHSAAFARKGDDGRAEAALIAVAGLRLGIGMAMASSTAVGSTSVST